MFPCKDCPDRELGCHDYCEKYKKVKAKRQADKDRFNEDKNYRDYLRDQRNKRLREKARKKHLKQDYYRF